MTSSSPFANTGKLQVLPSNTTLLFTPSINNNTGNSTQFIRQASTHNGTLIQQPVSSGIVTTPSTSIVRVNQPQQNQGQFLPQSIWTNSPSQQQFTVQKTTQPTSVLQYTTVKNEPGTPAGIQTQSSVIPTKVLTQPVVRQAVPSQGNTTVYTESQINDFVSKCRTFLTTLLRLAEKQAPEKLPMVRSCIQELLDGTIDPESFTQRLHTLYKSQPHVSLVPFFKLALPHMREIVKNTFGRPITIDLLEKLQLPPSSSSTTTTANNNNSITTSTVSNTRPGTATNVVVNPSLLSQTQNSSVLQQPLYTTVQPQQKINILQQAPQPTLIGSTGSLLSQQQQQQQQARAQIFQGITGIRPLVASLSTSTNPSLLNNHQTTQQVQPVTQMIIQPQTDSVLQRSFLSSTNPIQSTQIITVNHQPIKTETLHTHPTPTTISSIHQKGNFKIEDDYINDNNRQLIHDDRFISAMNIRRRFDSLDKDIRTSGLVLNDDGAFELISNGVRERLKYLLEQVRLIAQHRVDISMKNDSSYQTTSDVKSQIRFLEDLDKIEKQKKDKLEQEKIFRAAKSRSKTNDPEAAKLKQKAKEMQQAQVEEQRQKEANETALAAIGKPKKRKLEESTNHSNQLTTHTNGSEQISPIQPSPLSNVVSTNVINSKTKPAKRMCRANLRDLLLIMERDKYLKRTTLLVKALNK